MPTSTEETRKLRRDLRALVFLESAQTILAVGALLGIAVRAIVLSGNGRTAVSIAAIVLLALSYLALAVRVRMGQETVRRELRELELTREIGMAVDREDPYRAPAGPPKKRRPSRWARGPYVGIAIFTLLGVFAGIEEVAAAIIPAAAP